MPIHPVYLEQLRALIAEVIPFNHLLGIRALALAEGYARLEVPFRPELVGDPIRPALHGGIISTLIDACGGAAVFTRIVPPDKISTIDLRVDYLRPGELKTLCADAEVVRLGNRVAQVDVRAFHPDDEKKLIATGKAVYSIVRFKGGAAPAK